MASILKVDDLRGNTAAGNITITSEGGAATMQLQQGVVKAWAKVIQDSTHTLSDSLNIASIVDGGAGETDLLFTSSMSNALYAATQAAFISNNRRIVVEGPTTSQVSMQSYQVSTNSTATDATNGAALVVTGDLA